MKNIIACKNCHEENPFYARTCWKCHGYLRDKVYNIDLWKTIGRLTENPREAFKSIVLSDHKNFMIAVIFFSAIKFFIDSLFLTMLGKGTGGTDVGVFAGFFIALAITLAVISLFSILLKMITSSTEAKTRFRDNMAIFSYSLTPHALGLFILFPIEVVLFGGYLFSVNPSPFVIKETLAYTMAAFEGIILLWGFFLSVIAVFVQTRNMIFSFVMGLLLNAAIFYSLYLLRIIV